MDAPDSLASAAAGMRLQAERLAVISENLANASTTGFHARKAVVGAFADELRTTVSLSEAEGSLRRTDVDTDFALVGPGYFAVATPDGVRYTRDGHMSRDDCGFLCDARGHRVLGSLGPVLFPPGAQVDAAGRVRAGHGTIDRLRIAVLSAVRADDNGYCVAADSAVPKRAPARVQQRHLEDAAVDAIAEMSALIATQRAYEANQKSEQRIDETLKRAVTDVGRARS